MKEDNLINSNLNKENSKENKVKLKLKEYFSNNKSLIHENFNDFLEFIGLREIWSTEDEQKILWNAIISNSKDKINIDYDSALNAISSFLDEDDNDNELNISDEIINNSNKNIKDLNLDESDLNLFESKKISNNECIDEFLNSINNNQEQLYNIRFINEIFFNNKVNIEDNDNIKIDYDEILEKLNNEYKFININKDTFKTYLNHLDSKKTINNNENDNKNYYLNKNIISYVNAIINLKIEENNKSHNNENNPSINITLNSNGMSNNNLNGNSIQFNIEKLSLSDSNIISCLNGIIPLNTNIELLNLMKNYIENYIIYLRQSIYNEIKSKEFEYQQKISQTNSTNYICNICKKNIEKDNKKLNDEIKTFIRRNSKIKIQLNKDKSGNSIINLNDIIKNNKNSSSTFLRNSLSMPKVVNRKNSRFSQNMVIFNKKGLPQMSTDNLCIVRSDTNKPDIKSKFKQNYQNKISNGLNKSIYSSIDGNVYGDMTSSRIDIFSNYGNKEQFLLETTNLYQENLDDHKNINNKETKINNTSKFINKNPIEVQNKKDDKNNNNSINNNIIDIYSENNDENYDYFEDIDDNFIYNGKIHSSNKFGFKKNIDDFDDNIRNSDLNLFQSIKAIDNCYNTFAYGALNDKTINEINKKNNSNYSYINKAINNFYDFKYLGSSNRVKKLFSSNNEKININEFFSEEINVYFSKTNKQKCEIIITSQSFYFLKKESLECLLRVNLKLLETIMISSNNFNLLLLSFKPNTDIIIESYQRIQILMFLKKVIIKRNLENQIKITSSNKFVLRKSNGRKDTILTFKNKIFNLTPNFENSQKIGILLKYQENIFSASFHEKLVVLCPVGLIYFHDNYRTPKEIIPIIGTNIKPIVVQTNEKIYCLKIITINEEVYIFGSVKKKEILDWEKEIIYFKNIYNNKMKEINPNFSRKSTKPKEKENEDIFENKNE